MKIKRTAHAKNAKNTAKNEHARISAFSPTLSFDFHPTDGNTYLVGTEEGAIHRCSCSYNEQTLGKFDHQILKFSIKKCFQMCIRATTNQSIA